MATAPPLPQPPNASAAPPAIKVLCRSGTYDVAFAADAAGALEAALTRLQPAADGVLLVMDETVAGLHGGPIRAACLRAAGAGPVEVLVSAGEAAKSLRVLKHIWNDALRAGISRRSVVVALGGGSTTDVAGLAAATLLRGLRLVLVPTTLLAMADASIGGKTAINHALGKNLIGAFHPPEAVIISTGFLRTLPAEEFRSGLAEIAKAAVIGDAELFATLEQHSARLLDSHSEGLAEVLHRAIAIKAAIVGADEREQGPRETLNFGHTVGHALEAATGFAHFRHGEAVSLGMVAEARIAVAIGMCPDDDARRIEATLRSLGLPVAQRTLPVFRDVLGAMARDKKARSGRLRFALPETIGRVAMRDDVPERIILDALSRLLRTGEHPAV